MAGENSPPSLVHEPVHEPATYRENENEACPRDQPATYDLSRRLTWLCSIPPVAFLIVLMILLELEESIQAAPTVRLIESAICQKDHFSSELSVLEDEAECKTDDIQRRLAFVRGWAGLFDAIPTLLLSVTYGHLADKHGRRLIMFMTEAGMILSLGWILLTCYNWRVMPIQLVWMSSIFRFLGGGPNVAFAMIMTMAADISSDHTRSKTFYLIFSALLFTELVGPQIASVTMNKALWLSYLICALSLAMSFPVLLCMPDTRRMGESTSKRQSLSDDLPTAPRFRALPIIRGFLKDYRVVLGLLSIFTSQFRTVTIDVLLPYTSKRFSWSLSQTATLLSVIAAINLMLFLIVLPFAIPKLQTHLHLQIEQIDINVSRVSHALLATGALLLSFASTLPLLFLSLVVFAAGFGARLSMVSVITNYIPPSSTATLYTLISAIEEFSRLVGSPLVQAAWSQGITWGGWRIGFPFFIAAIVFGIGAVAAQFIPVGERRQTASDDASNTPLLRDGTEEAHSTG